MLPDDPQTGSNACRLSDADAAMLDRLIDAGFDRSRLGSLSSDDARRADLLIAQFGLLNAYPVEPHSAEDAETLIAATMARVARADDERRQRMRIEDHPAFAPARRGFRGSDLIAVASIAILATTLLVPIFNWSRGHALETQCANNLRLVASGLSAYTNDFQALPMRASLAPDLASWMGFKNSENLRVLSGTHYCPTSAMACPGDTDPTGSYAYQVPMRVRQPAWNLGPRVVIVGDRNPLVDLERNGVTIASVALNSASHGGEGQNLLFTDGSVEFRTSPYLPELDGRDNIWLPFGDGVDALLRRPGRQVDAFLLQ
ncbi:MAG: hypothetical protein U0572_17305 [Phycisphaerales bacterium]